MAALLKIFMPHLSKATVRTAVNHMAVGMGAFKSEELDMARDAACVLPLVHQFIVAILPHCNRAFTAASTDTACLTEPLTPHVGAVCDVLMLAIKTFESAVEVTLRYEIQGASELSRYASHGLLCIEGCCPSLCPSFLPYLATVMNLSFCIPILKSCSSQLHLSQQSMFESI